MEPPNLLSPEAQRQIAEMPEELREGVLEEVESWVAPTRDAKPSEERIF